MSQQATQKDPHKQEAQEKARLLRSALVEGQYFHPVWGVLSCDPHLDENPTCENYALFTVRYFHVLEALGAVPSLLEIIEMKEFISSCRISPGNFRRHPGASSAISQDELVAIAAFDPEAAKEIYEYGTQNDWQWPGEWGWLARHGYFVPFIRAAADKPISLFSQFLWGAWTIASCLSGYKNTSGKLLQWDQMFIMKGKGPVSDLAIAIWKLVMNWKYKYGLQEVMHIYFPKSPLWRNTPESWGI